MEYMAGKMPVDVLNGQHAFAGVPTSQWQSNRREVTGSGMLANLRTPDGLRAQVALVPWPDGQDIGTAVTSRAPPSALPHRLQADPHRCADPAARKFWDSGCCAVSISPAPRR